MTHEWTITRGTPNGQAVIGVLKPGDGLPCYTLERLAVLYPEGRYPLKLTFSPEVEKGHLWAPYDDKRLPEVLAVPDRSGIRLHALNHIMETKGCTGVGAEHDATELFHSQPALRRLVNELRQYERDGDDCWLTVTKGLA